MSFGETPGYTVEIEIMGITISGFDSFGMLTYE
jgi:hypothetical protein